MKVTVAFLVPVAVEVDTGAGTVERVVVAASAVVADRNGWCVADGDRVDGGSPEAVEAYEIAGRVVWPGWEVE